MRKKLIAFAIVIAIIGLLALAFTSLFEIADEDQYFPPSREALVNEYLALDRWLANEGHAVRVLPSADIDVLSFALEETILIQTDLYDWNKESLDYLDSWVEKGGSLILCLHYYRHWGEDELGSFLTELGLETIDPPGDSGFEFDENCPTFGRNILFNEPSEELLSDTLLTLKDEDGLIRLIQFSKGKGKITVTGRPRFMTSISLEKEANARLSWYLLAQNDGVLFVRGERRQVGLVGRIFQKGNFSIIIISALVLIIAGFWSAIPVFGVVKGNAVNRGKALSERFLAEGRFLNRFKALDYYRAVYFREIRRKLMRKENLSDEEIISRAASLLTIHEGRTSAGQALSSKPKTKKDFFKSVLILKKILERL